MPRDDYDFISLNELGLRQYPEDPIYLWGEIIPPKSKFPSYYWNQFYHPSAEPAGIPKLWILHPDVTAKMQAERSRYIWSQAAFWGGTTLVGGVIGFIAAIYR